MSIQIIITKAKLASYSKVIVEESERPSVRFSANAKVLALLRDSMYSASCFGSGHAILVDALALIAIPSVPDRV